mmetsp:Transcript_63557/g.131644  ORF Transcript_63557/g.131644 Transcript_63557/m.131644 type:complete len:220 (-) Transcript_63557:131-790(-)
MRPTLFVALQLLPQSVYLGADGFHLLLQRGVLALELLLTGFLFVDPVHVLQVLLLDNLKCLAECLDVHPGLGFGVLDVRPERLVEAPLTLHRCHGVCTSGLGFRHLPFEVSFRGVELLCNLLELPILALELLDRLGGGFRLLLLRLEHAEHLLVLLRQDSHMLILRGGLGLILAETLRQRADLVVDRLELALQQSIALLASSDLVLSLFALLFDPLQSL